MSNFDTRRTRYTPLSLKIFNSRKDPIFLELQLGPFKKSQPRLSFALPVEDIPTPPKRSSYKCAAIASLPGSETIALTIPSCEGKHRKILGESKKAVHVYWWARMSIKPAQASIVKRKKRQVRRRITFANARLLRNMNSKNVAC
jgi:hypothetical protein